MLAEHTNGDEATAFNLVIAQVKNFRLLNLREYGAGVVGLEEGIRRKCVLILHLIVGVVKTSIKALKTSFAADFVQMGGLGRSHSLLLLATNRLCHFKIIFISDPLNKAKQTMGFWGFGVLGFWGLAV